MIRTTFRYLVVAAIAATLVFLALALAPKDRAENAKFAVCQSKITPKCLTDLGVDLALNDTSLPRYMREVGMLAQMGRLEDAFTLEHRIEEAKGRSAENMEGTVNRRLASHRIMPLPNKGRADPEVHVLWVLLTSRALCTEVLTGTRNNIVCRKAYKIHKRKSANDHQRKNQCSGI